MCIRDRDMEFANGLFKKANQLPIFTTEFITAGDHGFSKALAEHRANAPLEGAKAATAAGEAVLRAATTDLVKGDADAVAVAAERLAKEAADAERREFAPLRMVIDDKTRLRPLE